MTLSTDLVGSPLPTIAATVERERLIAFAEATGSTDPRYLSHDAARAAGYPDIPVPPTFLFGLALEGPDPLAWIEELDVDLRFILHGAQRFAYDRMAFAGDSLDLRPTIVEVYERKGGALEFVVVRTEVWRGDVRIATLTQTIVIRRPDREVAA